MTAYEICLSLSCFTQYEKPKSIHVASNGTISFLWLSNISLYICSLSALSFTCLWTFRLLPCLGYCKYGCSEHWGACAYLNCSFLRIYAQEWGHWKIWQPYFYLLMETPYCSPLWLHQFMFLQTIKKDSLFSIPSPAFIICRLFDDGPFDWCEVVVYYSFIREM